MRGVVGSSSLCFSGSGGVAQVLSLVRERGKWQKDLECESWHSPTPC